MSRRVILSLMTVCVCWSLGEPVAGETPAGTNSTAQWMIERERAWAEQACGKGWVVSDLLAADFHGTSPKGTRYDKPTEAPAHDPAKPYSTDCRLLEADVRFFGANIAVIYGKESSVVALPDSRHERRCLIWTDTWLERNGKWQIIAAQDARVECPAT
jgi:hypothetical protein